jgi:chromosome segregation ATPase
MVHSAYIYSNHDKIMDNTSALIEAANELPFYQAVEHLLGILSNVEPTITSKISGALVKAIIAHFGELICHLEMKLDDAQSSSRTLNAQASRHEAARMDEMNKTWRLVVRNMNDEQAHLHGRLDELAGKLESHESMLQELKTQLQALEQVHDDHVGDQLQLQAHSLQVRIRNLPAGVSSGSSDKPGIKQEVKEEM